MKHFLIIILFLLPSVIFFSCSTDSTSTTDELNVEESVLEQAAIGYEINDIANTTNEVDELTNPGEVDIEDDFDIFDKQSYLLNKTKEYSKLSRELSANNKFSKTAEDSLFAFWADTSLSRITRTYWYYDSMTEETRLEIAVEFLNPLHRVRYDSSSIIVSGDKILTLYNLRLFKDTFILNNIETSLTATSWDDDDEVNGFTAVSTSTYNESSRVVSVTNTLTFNSDESGTISQEFEFQDGTSSSHSVTYGNGQGTFSREFRNGVTQNGSFNDVRDDGVGSFESLTSFPNNFYLVSIFKLANVVLNQQLRTATTDLLRVITFSSGRVDSTQVNIVASKEMDYPTIEINATRANGAHGTMLITKLPDFATLEGTWTTWDSLFVVITGERYDDGSSWLLYQVYENEEAYNNSEGPIAEAEYNFYADGSGEGRFTHRGTRYDMELDDTGRGNIIRNGARRAINMHR